MGHAVKLSIADKLALIYTSAGSMRKTAALAGLSHQQVSRILHKAAQGESLANYEKRPDIAESVQVAYDIHKDISRGVARRHGLPFDGDIPVYAERLPLTHQGVFIDGRMVFKGTPDDARDWIKTNKPRGTVEVKRLLGERVGALHLHWLPDRLRDKWIKTSQKTGAYYQASVGSIVNLPKYMKSAAQRITTYMQRGGIKTEDMIRARESLRNLVKDHVELQRVFTPYTSMDKNFPSELVTEAINNKLQDRHAPAVGEKGTALADQILLQLDTRKSRNAKPPKARGNNRRNRGSGRTK